METVWAAKAGTIRTRAADRRFNWCGFACPGLVWPPLRSRSCRAPSGSRYRPTRFQLPHRIRPVSGKGHRGLPAARGRPAPARAALGALVTASGMLPRPCAPSGFFRPHPSPLLRAAALPHSCELGGGGASGASACRPFCLHGPPACRRLRRQRRRGRERGGGGGAEAWRAPPAPALGAARSPRGCSPPCSRWRAPPAPALGAARPATGIPPRRALSFPPEPPRRPPARPARASARDPRRGAEPAARLRLARTRSTRAFPRRPPPRRAAISKD